MKSKRTAKNTIINKGHSWEYVQKNLAYSKEGHDDIIGIGKQILGYTPDENWNKMEQDKYSNFGTTPQDIRNDFVYSQPCYNNIINMAKQSGLSSNQIT